MQVHTNIHSIHSIIRTSIIYIHVVIFEELNSNSTINLVDHGVGSELEIGIQLICTLHYYNFEHIYRNTCTCICMGEPIYDTNLDVELA